MQYRMCVAVFVHQTICGGELARRPVACHVSAAPLTAVAGICKWCINQPYHALIVSTNIKLRSMCIYVYIQVECFFGKLKSLNLYYCTWYRVLKCIVIINMPSLDQLTQRAVPCNSNISLLYDQVLVQTSFHRLTNILTKVKCKTC